MSDESEDNPVFDESKTPDKTTSGGLFVIVLIALFLWLKNRGQNSVNQLL